MTFKRSTGFSLIEIMVVLFIMGLLFSMIGPRIAKVMKDGSTTATQATLNAVKTAILEYQMEIGNYPKTLQHLVENVDKNPSGLQIPSGCRINLLRNLYGS